MKYLSVCSGIEAATVAWHHMGWQPVAFSDIEPFPSAVLAHHYPHVPNLGDMTQFEEWNLEPIDLLVGGTPCQSFSVAGLRKGLADPRGNLMLTFLAIAQRQRPRWIVWENVPGVLSSNGGRDFGTFLGALGELGYGWAYRVLDAQWFGVAQRRRRVFVIGYLGDWRHPAKVLFESESVRRDTPPSREAREKTAKCLTAGVGKRYDPETETLPVAFDWQSGGDARGLDPKETAMLQRNQVPAVAQPIAMQGTLIGRSENAGPNGTGVDESGSMFTLTKTDVHAVAQPITQFGDVAGSLTARHDSSPCADRGQNVVAQPMAFRDTADCLTAAYGTKWNGNGSADNGSLFAAQPMAFEPGSIARNAGPVGESPLAPTLRREMGDNQLAVRYGMQVRRLTPVECERLQGFPDGYTSIPWRKKPESPDGPRYKALGNSMAVPVMRWIGERINKVENDKHD